MRIKQEDLGNFIEQMAVQFREGVNKAMGVGIDIEFETNIQISVDVIYAAQSLTSVTSSVVEGTDASTVNRPEATQTRTEAAFEQVTTESSATRTTTEQATTHTVTEGVSTDVTTESAHTRTQTDAAVTVTSTEAAYEEVTQETIGAETQTRSQQSEQITNGQNRDSTVYTHEEFIDTPEP